MTAVKNEELKSRPPNEETLLADKELHEKSHEKVTLTEHAECMGNGEKKRRSRDAIRLEVSEKRAKKGEGKEN
jgi:hypothetical protein